jgi:hypothetical protein
MLTPVARLLSASLAATVVSLAMSATPAHAQFLKKIKQAATEKAAEAAGRKALGDDKATDSTATTARPATAARSSATTSATPAARASGPAKLEITPERLAQFLTALEPATEAAKERAAHAAAEKKLEDYHACMAAAGQKHTEAMMKGTATGPTKAQQAEIDRLLDQAGAMNQRMLVAMQAGDTVKTRLLTDSSVAASTRAQALLNPFIGRMCGTTVPSKPAPLDESRLRAAEKPRRIDGWSPTQFGLMRERIALYYIAPDKSGVTPGERAAIDGRRTELAPFAAAWKARSAEWAGWSDVFSAWQGH